MPQEPETSGFQRNDSGNNDTNSMVFLFQQLAAGLATATLAMVKAVTNTGNVAAPGYVDVQPMVHQVDGLGNTTPHGTIYHLPYSRLLGGGNAVILDPVVGDIGIVVFASRDISSVKNTGRPSPPGSQRRNSMADGMYIGGVLGSSPTQFVRFSAAGIEITSTIGVKVSGDLTVTGKVDVNGGVTAGVGTGDSVTLQHHTHSGGSQPTAGT